MDNPALPAALAVFDAINTGDLRALPDLVTPDFIDHGSPFPLEPGPEGYRRILTWVTRVLKIHYRITDTIQAADRIVLRAEASGYGIEALHGPAAIGKPYTMTTIHIYRTEGARLAEHWGVRDEIGAMIQVGTLPAPNPAALDLAAQLPPPTRETASAS
ncbi:ester cyclase [Nocardia inohanensis]|uniref:ester cyclase n=1 Tax=Nocardia inohanensis TaxID=209246 RepID=UPI000833068E|nr:ester cyclase [Nocardia inohanensis]